MKLPLSTNSPTALIRAAVFDTLFGNLLNRYASSARM